MEKNLAHSIQQILIKSLGIQDIEVINNSHLHHHHQSSPQTGNSHFKVIIKSKELKSSKQDNCSSKSLLITEERDE